MKYPDLTKSKIMAFDVETYDPELGDKGPGVYRRDGNVLGIALADETGFAEYYNLGHPGTDTKEKQKNIQYARDMLAGTNKKVGANILYDLDWLENFLGIPIEGELHDVQIAEPLLNENQRVGLGHLMDKYTDQEKRISILEKWCADNGLPTKNPRQHIYMMDYQTVRQYALGDALGPIEILRKQVDLMEAQGLMTIYRMEMELIPLLLQMRMTGVRTNSKAIDNGLVFLKHRIKELSAELFSEYGEFNVNSSMQVGKVFDRLGINYPLTEANNPHLDKSVLEYEIDHPIAKQIMAIRQATKIRGTFFINSFIGHSINGRIHCMFHPNKTEKYGTKSGRFSSTNPNLQQIPSKDESYGKLCRSVFIPEEECDWGKIDWSQIEYRLMAHYGMGPNAEAIRQRYISDPNTDFHQWVMGLTGLTRKRAKVLNFGMAYAMGARTMHKQFGWVEEECKELIEMYNDEVPFIRKTRTHVAKVARTRGHIKTILGRRARVTPDMIEFKKEYQMFNRLIQGSAADLMKKAMRDAYRDGIFNVLIPHLTVHDELDFSVPRTKEGREACVELKHTMETCIKLKVPVVADLEIGPNWADVEEFKQEHLEL